MRDQQNTTRATEQEPLQTSRQVMIACLSNTGILYKEKHRPLSSTMQASQHPATAGPVDKHGQRSTVPKWPHGQQVGQTVIMIK